MESNSVAPPWASVSGRAAGDLVVAARALRSTTGAQLGDLGVHPGQEMLLLILDGAERADREAGRAPLGVPIGDLATRLQVEPPTTTRMVGRLERSGHVIRAPDPHDGRVVRVGLSESGRALLPRLREVISGVADRALAGLSPSEIATLRELLGRMITNLGPDHGGAPGAC